MKEILWYKLNGRIPVPDETNGMWMCKNNKKRVVAVTKVNKRITVSTVFLGLDHGWGEDILLFETLVFGGNIDGQMDRYSTWEEAELGHERMVIRVINELND